MNRIEIKDYDMVFQFPGVHDDAQMAVQFRRTLRVPDDSRIYPLPPSHKACPLLHLDDCGDRAPRDWIDRGGAIMPLYQAEAMWIAFSGGGWVKGYPCAVKIGAGKINVISGKPWKDELDPSDDDYVVVPRQPRLDGFCIAKRVVRQFVAMPLGEGYSVEEQLTGKGEHGGLQIVVYPMKREHYERSLRNRYGQSMWLLDTVTLHAFSDQSREAPYFRRSRPIRMGLGAGGRMKQPIYRDLYGIDTWDQAVSSNRCFVTIANARQWQDITGQAMPKEPPTAKDYAETGLPWFDYYGDDQDTRAGSQELALRDSVSQVATQNGEPPPGPDGEVTPDTIVHLGPGQPARA